MGKAKKIGIGFGIIVAIFFAFIMIVGMSMNTTEEPLKNPELSDKEIKDNAINLNQIGYENLHRYNEDHIGKIVFFSGEVIQVRHISSDSYVLRVDVNPERFETSALYVNYVGPRILEDDNVTIYGEVVGIKDYKAISGAQISIPEINALILNMH
tara:strand:- start:52 stop:516 length:465 start_codon:yes stop_codon:yes gene_type:complete